MTKDEALEMCLEYIETNALERRFVRWAIKEALAHDEDAIIIQYHEATIKILEKRIEELTAQPERQWVNLTVDELIDLERKHLSHENLTRAIEAKLKEKNT